MHSTKVKLDFMRFVKILAMTLVFFTSFSVVADDFIGSVPRPIYKLMLDNNCGPIRNFYEDFLVDQPPFLKLHGVADIFVCEFKEEWGETRYKLIFRISDYYDSYNKKHHDWYEFKECPAVRVSDYKYGGLSIDRSKQTIKGTTKEFLTLTIGKDGGFTHYYCNESKWHVYSSH